MIEPNIQNIFERENPSRFSHIYEDEEGEKKSNDESHVFRCVNILTLNIVIFSI